MSVSYTQEEIDALKAAIVSGVLQVTYNGPPARTIVYQSLAEMRNLLAEMVASASTEAGTRRRYRLGTTNKGL